MHDERHFALLREALSGLKRVLIEQAFRFGSWQRLREEWVYGDKERAEEEMGEIKGALSKPKEEGN